MKKIIAIALLASAALTGCDRAADVASRNLSEAGDNFELNRRVHFINTWSDREIMVIEGLCAKDNSSTAETLIITCLTGPNQFKKHYLGIGSGLSYFIEQLEPAKASTYHYRVIFAPGTLIPDLEVR